MFCQNCGISLPKNSKFCFECGAEVCLPKIISNTNKQKIALSDMDGFQVKMTEKTQKSDKEKVNRKKLKPWLVLLACISVCVGLLLIPLSLKPESIAEKWILVNTEVLELETIYDGNDFIKIGEDLKYKEIEFNEHGVCRMGGENGVRRDYSVEGNYIILHSVLSIEKYGYDFTGWQLILNETSGKERTLVYQQADMYSIIGDVDYFDILICVLYAVPFAVLAVVFVYAVCTVLYENFEKKRK